MVWFSCKFLDSNQILSQKATTSILLPDCRFLNRTSWYFIVKVYYRWLPFTIRCMVYQMKAQIHAPSDACYIRCVLRCMLHQICVDACYFRCVLRCMLQQSHAAIVRNPSTLGEYRNAINLREDEPG